MRIQRILTYSILFLLLSPFLILIFKFPLDLDLNIEEFFWAFKNTIYQASLSALVSLVMGTWVAWGLVKLSGHVRKAGEVLLLLPNFLPPLFTLLIVLYWIEPFPVGIFGIAFVHSVMNFGLVAVGLSSMIESKLGGMAELALVEGSGKFQFLRKVYWPLLKNDYKMWFLFVFSVCFSSFSVPLIVGGQRGTTLEVLIYEKIRLSLEWGSAVIISIAQLLVLALVSFLLVRETRPLAGQHRPIPWLGSWSGVGVLVLFSFLYLSGYVDGVYDGFVAWDQFLDLKSHIISGFYGTLAIAGLTGFLTVIFFAVLSFIFESLTLSNFMRAYIAPSTTLAGFAILVAGPNEGPASYFKIPLGLVILFVGALYRMSWEGEMSRLRGQVETARVLGGEPWSIFKDIVWPQSKKKAFMLAGLASAWACGDFALSRILAYKDISLALVAETLLSTYRLNLANIVSFGILLSSVVCFCFFWGWGYVGRRKSN